MPIDGSWPVALFVLPHQDDEFGVFGIIDDCRAQSKRAVCVFLTDGQANARIGQRRNIESRRVLLRLGVKPADIHFLGSDLQIRDGALYRHLGEAYGALLALFAELEPCEVYLPAWEGGHHDHDAAHAIGVRVCETSGSAAPRQFPLYDGANLPGPFFRVLNPLPLNGPVQFVPFGLGRACRYITLCLSYRSQWRTWVGLLPFLTAVMLLRRGHVLQSTDKRRLWERPHPGALFYERRFGVEYGTLAAAVADFLRK